MPLLIPYVEYGITENYATMSSDIVEVKKQLDWYFENEGDLAPITEDRVSLIANGTVTTSGVMCLSKDSTPITARGNIGSIVYLDQSRYIGRGCTISKGYYRITEKNNYFVQIYDDSTDWEYLAKNSIPDPKYLIQVTGIPIPQTLGANVLELKRTIGNDYFFNCIEVEPSVSFMGAGSAGKGLFLLSGVNSVTNVIGDIIHIKKDLSYSTTINSGKVTLTVPKGYYKINKFVNIGYPYTVATAGYSDDSPFPNPTYLEKVVDPPSIGEAVTELQQKVNEIISKM